MLLRLEPRGQRSRLWTYASPLLALALTVVVSAIIFSVLGKDPLESLYVFLVSPLTSATGLPELFVKAWIKESFNIAKADVYRTPIGVGAGPFVLTVSYKTKAHRIAEQRVALAGASLANLLNAALK